MFEGGLGPAVLSLLHIVAAASVTVDAVLRKRHVPSIIGWVGLAWLAPIAGALLYLAFGINRIRRTGVALGLREAWDGAAPHAPAAADDALAAAHPDLDGLIRLGRRITGVPLTGGNRVEPLVDGDQAYPAMLRAIEGARKSITLATYIFDHDAVGRTFLQALAGARQRGVAVRVLIDDVGARYARPNMVGRLRRAAVPAAAFLPTRVPRLFRYANLRNHRKIMVVDGRLGFAGGMNIRAGHWLARAPSHPVHCLHFEIEGPVVDDMQRTFATDWAFATGEQLLGDLWFDAGRDCGPVAARGIPDGPDHHLDHTLQMILGALAVARRRVRIVTPYFLPDSVVLAALKVTAMRGVDVDIVLPARSNIPLMDWAMQPQFAELLEGGCRAWLLPPPFDHTKIFRVDADWSLIGSTNWDARSLRLNFEYNLECYDRHLAQRLDALIDAKIGRARELTLAQVQALPFACKLRNGLARLLSPYL
jgi:cardiolipin synthase